MVERLNQLIEVVSSYRFLQSTCLREQHEEVGLVGGENKIRLRDSLIDQVIRIEAPYHILMVRHRVNCTLVLRFINFRHRQSLIQFH
jgi:hypothetical protein